jgi:hypothetical protein
MCGLVMAIVNTRADRGACRLARRDVHRAMLVMDSRGGDSWGIAVGPESCRIALRGLGPYSVGGNLPVMSPGDVLVGHTRFATRGQVNIANAHPFAHGDFSVAHNGAFRAPIPSGEWQDCDSYRLTGEITRSIRDGADVALEHGGYGTVIASDGEHAFLWRSSGQCHVVIRPWGLLVTSTPVEGLTGRIINVPDSETVYLIDATGDLTAWSRVTLAADTLWSRYPASWGDWPLTPAAASKRTKGSLAAAWEKCLACDATAQGCTSGVCRDCHAAWADV